MTAWLTKLCGLLISILAAAGVCRGGRAAHQPRLHESDLPAVALLLSGRLCGSTAAEHVPVPARLRRRLLREATTEHLSSQRGCVDDYCPKWFPKCLPGCLPPWFVCAPSGCGPCNTK